MLEEQKQTSNFEIVVGDLFKLVDEGRFDVIAQGNNCFNTQGGGIAVPFKLKFGTDKFKKESNEYYGDINKLGTIDYEEKVLDNGDTLTVVNSYTQYGIRKHGGEVVVDYEAVRLVMKKINHIFKGKRIGLPYIGAGLAGGDEITIEAIMREELKDVFATLVVYDK